MERKTIYLDDAIDAINKRIQFLKDDPVFIRKHGDIDLYGIKPILQTLPSAQHIGWVHRDDIYRLISGHSNYHGDNILAALTCLAEGKEVPNPIDVLELPERRKKGEWICEIDKYYSENIYCSICKTRAPYIYVCNDPYGRDAHGERKKTNFCPNCGADMRGEEE